jgi:peptidyl-prolyl cis-trans isomerase D
MALIGKIRRQRWLLIGSLAAALFLFIAMLMFDNPNQSFFGGSQTMVGDIEGRTIEYKEFLGMHDMLYRNAQSDGFSSRTSLWLFYVEDAIMKKEAEEIGLGVSKTELLDLQFGPNEKLSPIISSRYQDPNTRQVDREQLDQLKNIITTNQIDQLIQGGQLVPDFKFRWAHQEKEVIKDRLQTKLAKMVEKGIFTPTWMAEMLGNDQNMLIDFHYVHVPFDEINNTEVTLDDADYEAYFKENKSRFRQEEETRKVEYLMLDVVPGSQDSAAIKQRIADLIEPFRTAEDDSLFVTNNQGEIDDAYFSKDVLSSAIADTVFKVPVGTVIGPYFDVNAIKAVKLLGKKMVPDSVKAKHILRRAEDPNSLAAARITIDSLKALIEAGAHSFDSLAAKFSQDQSNAAKGGDLGFFGQNMMVKPFNDVCFFKAEPGKLYSVVTNFGVHLIQVTDRKFGENPEAVRLAYLTQTIVPSTETQNAVREVALQLVEENKTLEDLRKTAAAKGYEMETSPALKANDYTVGNLGAGQGSREIVRWAFGVDPNMKAPKVGKISPREYSFQDASEYYVNKYVVAGLKSIRPEGMPSLEDIKDEIEPEVINRKKGEIVKQKIQGKTDLVAIASTFSTQVDTAASVTFHSAFIPNLGAEPIVVAKAFKVDLNQISEPLVGNSGVFIVKPVNKPQATTPVNIVQVRMTSQQTARMIANKARMMQSLVSQADIEDKRSKFF